jgi:cGMP-dependent protein kinase
MVIENLVQFQVRANHALFKEGDVGNFFYIVKEGELSLKLSNTSDEIRLRKGDIFGELALIQKSKRSGTVVSITTTDIYCLEGNIFRDIVRKVNSSDMHERVYCIKNISIFKGLTNSQINSLAVGMVKCEFNDKQIILKEGDQRESLYIIKEGTVSCVRNDEEIKRLSNKDYFGEVSILFQTKRSITIMSIGKTVCFQITLDVLIETLGENFRNILLQGILKESFLNSKLMKNFVIDKYFDKIFCCFKLCNAKSLQISIPRKHYENRKLVVVIQGSLINVIIINIV